MAIAAPATKGSDDFEMFKKFQVWYKSEQTEADSGTQTISGEPKETSTPLEIREKDQKKPAVVTQVKVQKKVPVITRILPKLPTATTSRTTQTPQRSKKCDYPTTHVFRSYAAYRSFIEKSNWIKKCRELEDLIAFFRQWQEVAVEYREMQTTMTPKELGDLIAKFSARIMRVLTISDKERLGVSDDDFFSMLWDLGDIFDRSLKDICIQITTDAAYQDEADYSDNYASACRAFIEVFNSKVDQLHNCNYILTYSDFRPKQFIGKQFFGKILVFRK